jgi:hypothetical protein
VIDLYDNVVYSIDMRLLGYAFLPFAFNDMLLPNLHLSRFLPFQMALLVLMMAMRTDLCVTD